MKLRLKRVQKSQLGTGIIFRHSANILTETPEMKIPYVLPYPSITIRECNIHTFRVVNMTGHPKYYANNLHNTTGSKFDRSNMVEYFGQK